MYIEQSGIREKKKKKPKWHNKDTRNSSKKKKNKTRNSFHFYWQYTGAQQYAPLCICENNINFG